MFSFKRRGTEVPPLHRLEAAGVLAAPAPSPLLVHLAGEHAPAVASLWPAPHAPFLAAAAARRHLICLIASRRQVVSASEAQTALRGDIGRAVRDFGGPPGLRRALPRLGEVAWPAEDYARLFACLKQPHPARVLRHAEAISPDLVRSMNALPPALIEAGGGLLRLNRRQAEVLTDAHRAIAARDGADRAARCLSRWARRETPAALFEAARQDLALPLGADPLNGAAGFRTLRTAEALKEAGKRFGNCLGDCEPALDCAYYEWRGQPHMAVCLVNDWVYGWRLNEAKMARNEPPPPAARERLVEGLRALGIYCGPSGWWLNTELCQQARGAGDWTPPPWMVEVFGAVPG